jgi:hypothetical protein
MNRYYITTREKVEEHKNHFHPQKGSHCIDLDDGKILLTVHWPEHDDGIERFEADEGVEVLPRVMTEGTKPLDIKHSRMLEKIGHVHGETILHLAKRAGEIHRGMKIASR